MKRQSCHVPLAALLLLTGWAFAQEKPRSLYDGASLMFERAQLVKPRESTNLALAFALAPLIVTEALGTNPPARPTRVFFQSGTVQFNGREYVQMAYWWRYNEPRPVERRRPARRGPDARPLKRADSETSGPHLGVRLTLNTNGSPLIYEILAPSNAVAQIFVSQSLEAAARAQFGAALPGRRHAVERSLDEAPGVVVPRIVEDPPAVMGPIVYLHAESRSVATLICRCMDAQARELVGQGFYELVPADFSGNVPRATRLDAANPRGLPEDFTNPSDCLSRSLRLPPEF